MKAKRPRGMRELMTVQGLAGRTVPDSREQIMSEQARLEYERARLQRELDMWQENVRKTTGHLQIVEDRILLLRRAIEPMLAPDPIASDRRQVRQSAPESESEPPTVWHEVVLEY